MARVEETAEIEVFWKNGFFWAEVGGFGKVGKLDFGGELLKIPQIHV